MDGPKLDGSMQHFISAVVHNALKLITAVLFQTIEGKQD
jgi:hypothetical protein